MTAGHPVGVRVALRIYRHALALYPRRFRRRLGDELTGVFERAAAEPRGGAPRPLRALARELRDLPGAVAREHLREVRRLGALPPRAALRALLRSRVSLVVPLGLGALALWAGILLAEPWGLFFAPSYVALPLCLLGASLALGRAWGRGRRIRGVAPILCALVLLAPAVRLVDEAWLARLRARGGTVDLSLPGIRAHVGPAGPSDPLPSQGLRVTTLRRLDDGTRQVTSWWRSSTHGPSYEVWLAVAALGLALAGQARVARLDPRAGGSGA